MAELKGQWLGRVKGKGQGLESQGKQMAGLLLSHFFFTHRKIGPECYWYSYDPRLGI